MVDFTQIFNDSYERINRDPQVFYDVFYGSFIASSEEVAKAFENVDMERQRVMLESSFIFLTAFAATQQADDYFLNLARVHREQRNIKPHMFDLWVEALIETVAELDKRFDHNVEIAWRVTVAPGVAFMKHYRGP